MTIKPFTKAASQRVTASISIFALVAVAISITAALFFGVSPARGSAGDDQVVASFERELNRTPGPAVATARLAIDEDGLYQRVNEIHWTTGGAGTESYAQIETSQDDRPCRNAGDR